MAWASLNDPGSSRRHSRSEPLELPGPPALDGLPELDDCPDAGLCGEIWPLPVPVLPAFEYWLLPVPGPPGWLPNLSSIRPLVDRGLPEPLCCVEDWVPLCDSSLPRSICEPAPPWVPRFICWEPELPV